MKKYNFDEQIERRGSGCVKYDDLNIVFGKSDILPLWIADMDFRVADVIIEDIQKQLEHGVLGYSSALPSVYKSIVNWVKRRNDWDVKAGWITFCPGVVPGLSVAVQAFTKPGDKVIIQPPVYPPFFRVVKENNRTLVENRLIEKEDGYYVMDYEDLESKLKDASLFILCSPHNPVGRSWTKEELMKLGELCLKYNVPVICDEIHADLHMPGHKHIHFANLTPEIANNTFTFLAASKTFNIAGLSQGIGIASNADMLKKYNEEYNRHFLDKSLLGLVATRAAFDRGEEWLSQAVQYVSENADYVISYINKEIPKVKVRKPEASYLLWLDFRSLNLSQADLVHFLVHEAGIGMNDGTNFGENGKGFVRMNLACPRATLEKALKQLKDAMDKRFGK